MSLMGVFHWKMFDCLCSLHYRCDLTQGVVVPMLDCIPAKSHALGVSLTPAG